MKNIKNKFLALMLITSFAFFSCKKEDLRPIMPATTSSAVDDNPTFTNGEWIVSSFNENGTEEMKEFNGYVFVFNTDGKIQAKNATGEMTGTWSQKQSADQKAVVINFPSAPLNMLNKEWNIKSVTFSTFKLESNGDASDMTDYLIFSKNQNQAPGNLPEQPVATNPNANLN